MKLKAFQKVNTSVETIFYVMNKGAWKSQNFEVIDSFKVNYLEKDNDKLKAAILKRIDYENNGAVVVNVDAHNDKLDVTIEI